jgi:hypothetical protein
MGLWGFSVLERVLGRKKNTSSEEKHWDFHAEQSRGPDIQRNPALNGHLLQLPGCSNYSFIRPHLMAVLLPTELAVKMACLKTLVRRTVQFINFVSSCLSVAFHVLTTVSDTCV